MRYSSSPYRSSASFSHSRFPAGTPYGRSSPVGPQLHLLHDVLERDELYVEGHGTEVLGGGVEVATQLVPVAACSCIAWQYVDFPTPTGPITSWAGGMAAEIT